MEEIIMSTLEANLALLSTIPEECQKEIQNYLLTSFCGSNPYKPLSENEILSELSESRMLYDSGEGEELGKVISEIGEKYGL